MNIEDEPLVQEIMKRLLKGHLGYDLEIRGTLQKGKQTYDSRDFDLTIIDTQLPDGLGFDFIRYVRGKGDQMPIILYSGDTQPKHEKLAYELGADDFMHKPFEIGELTEKVQKLIFQS